MQVIKAEGGAPVKAWVGSKDVEAEGTDATYKQPDIEDSALAQLKNLARLPFWSKNGIAVMADVHAGVGATVGSVLASSKAVIPSAVGVDIGCVDCDSEYLSPTGWRRIADYDGGPVMQYDLGTDTGYFVHPVRYIVKDCSVMYRLRSKYGIDQVLSPDHKMLVWKIRGRNRRREMEVLLASEFVERDRALSQGYKAEFKTTFQPVIGTAVDMSNERLRVYVMFSADGYFDGNVGAMNLKKQRKIERARYLLQEAGIEFSQVTSGDVTTLRFDPPEFDKSLRRLWPASLEQLRVIVDEVLHWDGCEDESCYYTSVKENADFIHYAFTATGRRGVMRCDVREHGPEYRVFAQCNTMVGMAGDDRQPIEEVASPDGKAYCFTVPSGFWVMRRGGNIVMTGNCGMMAVRTSLTANDLPTSLAPLRGQIERDVPTGFGEHSDIAKVETVHRARLPAVPHSLLWAMDNGKIVRGDSGVGIRKALKQMGSLGGGNHFIEICLDEEQRVWIMLHSGSRGIGNQIGRYFIDRALELCERWHVQLPHRDLAYLPKGDPVFDQYVEAVEWAQKYALENRRLMLELIVAAMRRHLPAFELTDEAIACHHNYCIPASERIWTEDGPRSIATIVPGDKIVAFDPDGGLTSATVKATAVTGHKKINTIGTMHRKIRASGDHPVLTVEISKEPHPDRNWHQKKVGRLTWKTANTVQRGDLLVCAAGVVEMPTTDVVGHDMARFIGAYLGDGWRREKTAPGYTVGLAIGRADEPVTLSYLALVQKLFPRATWGNNKPGAFGLTCSSKEVHKTIDELGLAGRSTDKVLPSYCYRMSLAERLAVLSGYVDADGCIFKGMAKVQASNEALVRDLRELATSCGIICSNVRHSFSVTNYGPSDMWNFQMSPAMLTLWHTEKASAADDGRRRRGGGLGPQYTGAIELPEDVFVERVLSNDLSDEEEEVFDIEIDHPFHAFVCEGVVVHNCSQENHFGENLYVTRKGAVRAREGDLGIIPGSMGQRSYIVRGKGNPESYCSCSHGAGRRMSRTAARKLFTSLDLAAQTEGVECRKDDKIVDELPAAYKDIDEVMALQTDLVEVVHTLKQVLCVKGES